MALTTAGLPNLGSGQGVTAHYSFGYDTSLLPNGAAAVAGLMQHAEADFSLMQAWFGGIDIPFDYPLGVQVDQSTNSQGGAGWLAPALFSMAFGSGSYVQIDPGSGPGAGSPLSQIDYFRFMLVAEVTEMFMMQQSIGWFIGESLFDGGSEGSAGEGLSRFLAAQFLIHNNLGSVPPYNKQVATSWLNGPGRPNYIDNCPDNATSYPIIGCTNLFLWYLHGQLGFSVNDIVHAPPEDGLSNPVSLAHVYRYLTGQPQADAWADFITLVDIHYPPGSSYHPDGDNIFPVSAIASISAPHEITCGHSTTAEIFIDRPAMAEVNISLTSNSKDLLVKDHSGHDLPVKDQVTVPVGKKSVKVTLLTLPQEIPFNKSVIISAAYAGITKTARILIVSPRVATMEVNPANLICGDTALGTITLDFSSLKGPANVIVASNDPDLQVPSRVVIDQGAKSSDPFNITSSNIPVPFHPRAVSVTAALGGKTAKFVVHIVPPSVSHVAFLASPDHVLPNNTIACGASFFGQVRLDRASLAGDVLVELSWLGFPMTVNGPLRIVQGTAEATFPLQAPPTVNPFGTPNGWLSASYLGTTVSAELILAPSAATGVLATVALEPSFVVGGESVTAVVRLENTVNTATIVTLETSPTARVHPGSTVPLPKASVPSTVTVAANTLSQSFLVTTEPLPASATDRTIAIVANAFVTKIATLAFTG
jgi:hypothetical protein